MERWHASLLRDEMTFTVWNGVGFDALYNASWLRQRHGHKTPDQIGAEQEGLETDAATEFKLAA